MSSKIIHVVFFLVVCHGISVVEMAPKASQEKVECMQARPHRPHDELSAGKCMGKDMKLTEEQNLSMEQCRENIFGNMTMTNANSKDKGFKKPPMKKITCHMVCVGRSLGLLDGKGQPVPDEELMTAINAIFPDKAQKPLIDAIKECKEKYGSNLMMKDNDCSSYREFLNCANANMKTICDPEYLVH